MVFFIMPLLGQEVQINIRSPFKSKHLEPPSVNSECKILFETEAVQAEVFARIAKAKDEIPIERIWLGTYFKREIEQGNHPPISIRYINDLMGFGVFVEEKVGPRAFVGEYTGVIQKRTQKQLKDKKYVLRYTTWDGCTHFSIDAEEKGNFTRLINHSDEPNLELQAVYLNGMARMIFTALREIQKEEQLTFDYGPLFWNS